MTTRNCISWQRTEPKGNQSILREKGFTLSLSTISRKLKRMNIGRKKLKLLPDIDSAEQRVVPQRYVTVIKEIPDEKIFFLDETGFNLHTTGSYGYSPLHLPAIRKVSKSRGKNISMIALISNKKIERYRLEEVITIALSYLEFFKDLFVNEIIKGGDSVICDNVAFHNANEVSKFF